MKLETITILFNAAIVTFALATLPVYARDFDPKAFVTAHNKWRAEVGVPKAGAIGKLSYSPALAVSAQAWADTLRQTNHCQMRHSNPDGKYGENLFWGSAMNWSDGRKELQKISPQQVVDSWGSEKADYDYANNSCDAWQDVRPLYSDGLARHQESRLRDVSVRGQPAASVGLPIPAGGQLGGRQTLLNVRYHKATNSFSTPKNSSP